MAAGRSTGTSPTRKDYDDTASTGADRPQVQRETKKPGHLENLDEEQTEKLKQLWKRFFTTVDGDGGLSQIRAQEQASDGAALGGHDADSGNPSSAPKTSESSTGTADASAQSAKKPHKQPSSDDAENAKATHAAEEAELSSLLSSEGGKSKIHRAFWEFCLGEHPDALLLRFLRARQWDMDKAFKMLVSTLKWRLETNVRGILRAGDQGLGKEKGVLKNFRLGKCYYRGTDREGRPLIFARVKKHKASDQTTEEMLKFIVFNMEMSRSLLPLGTGVETSSVVFDMTGFGLGNMDWDTATMVINIFQSYYPETLGHAIVWNAPAVFSAVWKIVKPMLDPAVREKIAFCSSGKEIDKFIEPKHLEKDFGGSSTWSYKYDAPQEGENKAMDDHDTREKRMDAFVDVAEKLEAATQKWISGESEGKFGGAEREKLLKELEVRRLDMSSYVRGATPFTRNGTVVGDGRVIWRYDHGRKEEFGVSANEWAQEVGVEEPSSRPENKSPEDTELVLDTDEDTVSSTDPSEDEILNDPEHHHHSAVAVGFAQFGDNVANKFSKITPGPSIHEKRRQKKMMKHEEHEERRQAKLERKRLRLEKRRQEEEEERKMTEEEREEAVNSSYASYLASFGNMTISATNKAADYVPAIVGGNYLKQMTSPSPAEPAA